ncbi:MAG: alkaline phosphatase family protein [Anaerolineae bacterium]
MNALATWLLDLWQRIVAWYLSWRYGPVARQLGTTEEDGRPGFIIVQIDGLGHGCLLDAMAKGQAPFLASLLHSGQSELASWFTGLPSTTPAVQAGIMYGTRDGIPGFRWYEKESGTSVVSKNPASMHRLQDAISGARPGILEGGSSYANMFDGGAATSLFTLAAIGRDSSIFQRLKGFSIFLVLLFSPLRSLRIIWQALTTYLTGVWRSLASVFWPSRFARLGLWSPLYHVVTDVLVREVETFSVLVDLYRSLPAIFVNYSSYDNWAHLLGPSDPHAYQMLRAIDGRIQQIDRMRRRVKRQYDLYVLSDHGMAACVPFDGVFGSSLGQLIAHSIDHPVLTDELLASAAETYSSAELLGHEAGVAEAELTGLSSEAARTLRRSIKKRERPEPPSHPSDSDVVVRSSGPLSHVYLTAVKEPLTAEQIEAIYPGLMERLANHPGISLAAARGANGPVVAASGGIVALGRGTAGLAFAGLEDAVALGESLAQLLRQPNCGDLVLHGRWRLWGDGGRVVSFERQLGTHGGAGGEQCCAFVMAPAHAPAGLAHVTGPEQLYTFFREYREPATAREHQPAPSSVPVPRSSASGRSGAVTSGRA